MLKKLKKMKEKLVVGDQAIEMAKAQKQELKKLRKLDRTEVKKIVKQEQILQDELDKANLIRKNFESLQEEHEYKSEKLEELWNNFQ